MQQWQPMFIPVIWMGCGDRWCELTEVDLTNPHFDRMSGVYIIWLYGTGYGQRFPRAVRVGQGRIKDRLEEHKRDPAIQFWAWLGPLYVTWTAIEDPFLRDGAERYLGRTLQPLVGERFPEDPWVVVNLPYW